MKETSSLGGLTIFRPAGIRPGMRIWLFVECCAAGFPSPATDYVQVELNLNDLCINHRATTFFVRANGSSMEDLGQYDGDVMAVDRAEKITHGDIVIVEFSGEFPVKRLQLQPRSFLRPMIYPEELHLPGVIT